MPHPARTLPRRTPLPAGVHLFLLCLRWGGDGINRYSRAILVLTVVQGVWHLHQHFPERMDEGTAGSSKFLKLRGLGALSAYHLKQHGGWVAAAAAIFVVGAVGSFFAGTAVAHDDVQA